MDAVPARGAGRQHILQGTHLRLAADHAMALLQPPAQHIRLPRPAADGAPRYVTAVDTARNVVTVGPETLLSVRQLRGDDVVWLAAQCVAAGADEVFLTSSLRDVQAVARWDGVEHAAPGPKTAEIAAHFLAKSVELVDP